jgi:HSP20 family protein
MPRTTGLAARTTWPVGRLAEWPELGLLGEVVRTATADTFRVEEFVAGDKLVIRAGLPGIDPDKDVDVSISGGTLHVSVSREDKLQHKARDGFRTEFRDGAYSRSIALPTGTHESEAESTYVNGILEVRVPIAKTKTRKIQVKH